MYKYDKMGQSRDSRENINYPVLYVGISAAIQAREDLLRLLDILLLVNTVAIVVKNLTQTVVHGRPVFGCGGDEE